MIGRKILTGNAMYECKDFVSNAVLPKIFRRKPRNCVILTILTTKCNGKFWYSDFANLTLCPDPLPVTILLAAVEWWDLAEDVVMDITSTITLFLISL